MYNIVLIETNKSNLIISFYNKIEITGGLHSIVQSTVFYFLVMKMLDIILEQLLPIWFLKKLATSSKMQLAESDM